jgi:putative (di)nucleoside polyphosphate hydrolase
MLVNMDGKVFVGQRIDSEVEAWQMPQGGIGRDHVEIIAKARDEHFYDLPSELVGKLWGGKFRGQRQIWFLARFLGGDHDINIATHEPEFSEWKWISPEALPDVIVPFKRKLYRDILQEFKALI